MDNYLVFVSKLKIMSHISAFEVTKVLCKDNYLIGNLSCLQGTLNISASEIIWQQKPSDKLLNLIRVWVGKNQEHGRTVGQLANILSSADFQYASG